MPSRFSLCFVRTALFSAWIRLPFCGLVASQAGTVRSGATDSVELPRGYLTVNSATDRFDDGGVQYYIHSSYLVYTADGRLIKKVENHVSLSDEVPELVTLPAGYYVVEARSDNEGYIRIRVVIRDGLRTSLDLDGQLLSLPKQLARADYSRRLAAR
jgi:hypothetical protein